MNQIKQLISGRQTFALYSTSSLALKFATMIASIAILRWVSPEEMGVWQSLLLFQSYGDFMRVGLIRGLNREYPYYLGKNEASTARELVGTAQLYSLIVSLIGAAAFLLGLLWPFADGENIKIGLMAMSALWFFGNFRTFLQATFRGSAEFDKLSYQQFFEVFLQLVSIALVVWLGFSGMVIRAVVISIVMSAFLFAIRPVKVPLMWRRDSFAILLKTGLPLFGIGYLYTLAIGFNRLILLQVAGVEGVGLFTPVLAVVSLSLAINGTVASYFNPRLVYQLGQGSSFQELRKKTVQCVGINVILMIPLFIGGWFLIPWAIEEFFAEYVASIEAIKITLIATIFWAGRNATLSLYAIKAWGWLYGYMIVFALTAYLIPLWFTYQMDNPLNAVAYGGLVSGIFMFVFGLVANYYATLPKEKSLL